VIGVLKRIKDHEDEVDGKRVHEAKGERPMKKSVIVTVAAAVALVTTLCGCASLLGGGGPSDAELVAAALAGWKTGMEAQDIDKMMAQISEDFQGQNGGKPGHGAQERGRRRLAHHCDRVHYVDRRAEAEHDVLPGTASE